MPLSLRGSSVVVIGGSSGIGLATARRAADAGAHVTIVGRDEQRLAAASAQLEGDVRAFVADVADEAAVAKLFASVDEVDHVVNLAGTHVAGTIADLDTSMMRGPVDNRFWGPIHVCKHAPPRMSGGSITLCTGAGVARPRAGAAIVAAAAGGSEVLAKAMALELAPVRVNVVRPGIVDTPLLDRMAGDRRAEVVSSRSKRIPVGRIAQPDEIAHAIEFLMTNDYVTGTVLTVDGGHSLI
jgi:NAD(P)-dependent dehydrogenase (short-subunit alcohol dehydrogenase family)